MAVHAHLIDEPIRRARALMAGDRRRHRRVPLELSGRFMRSDRSEYSCTLRDISVGGACVMSDQIAEVGERIVAYFDQIGGMEGIVTRAVPGGFAFQYKVSEHKREKLAAQITWLINRDAFPDELGRQHERASAVGRRTTLRFDDGVMIDVELLDLSQSGASLGTAARPTLGEEVYVGGVNSVVRRHHDNGIGVQFFSLQNPDALRANFP